MKNFKEYFLNWTIGLFPFLAIAYHLFWVHQAYRLKGLLVAIISFFTPVLSDAIWFFYTMETKGFLLSHIIGIVGIVAGFIWYYRGHKSINKQHA